MMTFKRRLPAAKKSAIIIRRIVAACMAALMLLGVVLWTVPSRAADSDGARPDEGSSHGLTAYTPVIDAGHGGEDGGAVSATGVIESALNLEIALRLEALLELLGYTPVMVRRTDISLHSPDATTMRQRKSSDLKNRTALVNSTENSFLISIHQNTFGQSKYRGTHVFFSDDTSAPLAERLQDCVREQLAPDNNRVAKKVDSSIYIFKNSDRPGILVECGFLTNSDDLHLLQQTDYQKKLAALIAGCFAQYCSDTGSEAPYDLQTELVTDPTNLYN